MKSWDRTHIPKPGARVVAAIGAPMRVARDTDEAGLETARVALEQALGDAERTCAAALERPAGTRG
jgi:lysophospholipid acyltransferase (LPLAT)-like uncharacterized protein